MLVNDYNTFIDKGQERLSDLANGRSRYQRSVASSSNYTNLSNGHANFDGSKFPFGISGSGRTVSLDHTKLVKNARDAYHDVPQAKAIVDQKANFEIDKGLILEPTPNAELLGITDDEALAWADDQAARFHLWASSNSSMLDGRSNFYQAQYLMSVSDNRDGEYFIRLHYNNKPGLMNPLQLQFIDPLQLDGNAYTNTDGYQHNEDGIIRDKNGFETAYKIEVVDKKGESKVVTVPRFTANGQRILMIHGFKSLYAGQTRGFGCLDHCLQELQDITTLSQAHLHKAINQASHVAAVVPSKDAPASDAGFGDVAARYTQPSSIYGADPTNVPAGETPLPLNEALECLSLPQARIATPGSTMIFGLQRGEDFKHLKDTAPSDAYNAFVDAFMAYITASSGIAIESLLMRFGENYSASRATLILTWNIAEMARAQREADALNPIYNMWTAGEIASGRTVARGWNIPLMRSAWLNANWIGKPMPQIDPAALSKANMNNLEMGATTLNRVARELNGSSVRDNKRILSNELQGLPTMPWGKSNG